mgnify:CR=1 FL=1
MKKTSLALTLLACGGLGFGLSAGLETSRQPVPAPANDPPAVNLESLGRFKISRSAYEAMDEGRFDESRAILDTMLAAPANELEIIAMTRLKARSYQLEGAFAQADEQLLLALAELDARPGLEKDWPTRRGEIMMDRAYLYDSSIHDYEQAIRLYDAVAALPDRSVEREDGWIARQNAAMTCGQRGRHTEALKRAQDLLDSRFASEMTQTVKLHVRRTMVSWARASGDLQGAFDMLKELWRDCGDRTDDIAFSAGVQLATLYPVPDACAPRLEIVKALLRKIEILRTAPPPLGHYEFAINIAEEERSVLVICADSYGCPQDVELVRYARARLGLPAVP